MKPTSPEREDPTPLFPHHDFWKQALRPRSWDERRTDFEKQTLTKLELFLGPEISDDDLKDGIVQFLQSEPWHTPYLAAVQEADSSTFAAFCAALRREATVFQTCCDEVLAHGVLTRHPEFLFYSERAKRFAACWGTIAVQATFDGSNYRPRRSSDPTVFIPRYQAVASFEAHVVSEACNVAQRHGAIAAGIDISRLSGLGLMVANSPAMNVPPYFKTSEPGLCTEPQSFVPVEGIAALPFASAWVVLRGLREDDLFQPCEVPCPGLHKTTTRPAAPCKDSLTLLKVWNAGSREWTGPRICDACKAASKARHNSRRR